MHTQVLDKLSSKWEVGQSAFEPYARFVKAVDKVVVVTEDCSTSVEQIVGSPLSLHHRSHEADGKRNYVGFEIDGVQEFCRHHEIPLDVNMDLVSILKKMAETHTKAMPAILDVAIPLLEDNNIISVIL
ncbi:MAG: hypothetical protein ABL917_03310 [Parcubacteria group bacterium]